MKKTAAVWVVLACAWCASAQVTLSIVRNGAATPAGAVYDFGPVAVGNVVDAVFRLTNTGGQQIYLTNLSLAGPGFAVSCLLSPDLCGTAPLQQLPKLIGPAGTLDFTVQFQPVQVAKSSSANMTIDAGNTIPIILTGEIVPGLVVLLNNQALAGGQAVSFGSVQAGSSQTLKLMLSNPATNPPLAVPAIPQPPGKDFTLAGGALTAPTVAPGASAELDVTFAPSATGPRQGTLTIGLLTYPLEGTGTAPPPPVFPAVSVQLSPAATGSAQQATLAVKLASAAATAGSGTVTLAFQPAVSSVADDPSVVFADGTRTAAFTVAKGASAGQFAGTATVSFSTGTTAGTLAFSVTLGSQAVETKLVIPAAVTGIDAAVAARNVACVPSEVYCTTANVQLQINGWDNTRSMSEVVFTFFNAAGNPISPGNIPVNAGNAFAQYFAGSDLGGVFGLSALFPVNGDADMVVAAQVQMTNSAGTAQSARITF